jgi:hypothetical protein
MNGTGLLLLLAGVGVAAYVVMNQSVTVAGAPSSVPITSSGPLTMNCPGDPGCPGNVTSGAVYGPSLTQLGAPITAAQGTAGLGSLFRMRGPGGWAA